MTRAYRICIALGLTVIYIGPSFAAGTPAQRRACRSDAFRLCREYIPFEGRVKACMIANFSQLSPPCRAQFRNRRG